MITSFRKFFQSKFGMAVFLGFLALVALAFAGADITGNTFGGVIQGERVALVGDDEVTANELTDTAQSTLRTVQRQNPGVTMPVFIEQGGLDEVLSQMIDRYAVGAYAERLGLRAGENLVNSEIIQIPAFRGVSGEFDQATFEAALANQRIPENVLRRDLADGLLAQQILLPAIATPQMPEKVARQYASLFLERRSGAIALVPSVLFRSDEEPDDAAVEAYYTENRDTYVLPERRTLRFTVFNADNLDTVVTPSAEEIAARYEENAAQYAAREARDVTLFTVPTQDGAQALVDQIRAGKSLEAAARDAGFNTTQVVDRDAEQFAASASFAAAQAVFAGEEGAVVDPAQGTLGWYVARVDKVTRTPERTLGEATGEITEALTAEKRVAALSDLSARIEEQVDLGTSLTEIADTFELDLEESPALLSDGRVFGAPQSQSSPALRPILDTAFALDESEPQLDALVPGSQFLLYEVVSITESAAPALALIKERVAADLKLSTASTKARETAQRLLDKTRGGESLADAVAAEESDIPPPDPVSLARAELQQIAARGNVPPALVLLFSMSAGTVKLLEAPGNQGWILIALNEVTPGELEEGNPLVEGQRRQLAEVVGEEYSEQIRSAMRETVGVETNEDALATVRAQLLGET
ncbi:MAG: SurA N-terminal domain-containing protein [Pseudomonadota bacterium]